MKRNDANTKYKWDFSYLYKDDVQWRQEVDVLINLISQINQLKNILHIKENFFKMIDLERQSGFISSKLSMYLRTGDIDQSDERYQMLESELMNKYHKVSIDSTFIGPELKSIGFETIKTWLTDNTKYKQYLMSYSEFFESEKHVLEERDEKLLQQVAITRSAVSDMYGVLAYADRENVEIKYKNKKQVLTNTLMTEILENSDPIKDQELRLEASKLFAYNFTKSKHAFAKIYESTLQGAKESIEIRKYDSILQRALFGDSVDISVYLKLLEVGKKNIQPYVDYINVIKKHFKLDEFYPTDSSLKLVKKYNKTFTVEEGKSVIKNALALLGEEYLHKLDIAWSDSKIDYFEDTNKRDGAYSTGGDGLDPIILMNWDDKYNSVSTLAHEIGHSVHTLFADENQTHPLNQYPIILAEVASTINEHLLFDYMFDNANDLEEKIYLLQNRISDLCGTFYRQIQFANFEYQASQIIENTGGFTADGLNDLFLKIQKDYGYNVFDKNEKAPTYSWPRILHFFESPFYVYKYAIDITASFKLYNDIKNGDIQSTINFLKAGGNDKPLNVLKSIGVDFEKEETYQPLIEGISNYVQELKRLLLELK